MLAIRSSFVLACCLVAIQVSAVAAADRTPIQVENLHLCCGKCGTAVTEALESVKGIDAIEVDRKTASVRFVAADAKQADAALAAIAEAGFFGKATQGDKELAFPSEEIDPELKSDQVVFTDVHLCCGKCVRGVANAYEDLKDVLVVDCDMDDQTVTLTGKNLSVTALRDALRKAGFNGAFKKD